MIKKRTTDMHAVYSIVANTCPQLCSLLLLNNSSYTTEPQGGGGILTLSPYTQSLPLLLLGSELFTFLLESLFPTQRENTTLFPRPFPYCWVELFSTVFPLGWGGRTWHFPIQPFPQHKENTWCFPCLFSSTVWENAWHFVTFPLVFPAPLHFSPYISSPL